MNATNDNPETAAPGSSCAGHGGGSHGGVVDDEERENEGDLIFAAEHATPEALAFAIRHSTGLVCVAVPPERADELDLPLMVPCGEDPNGTAFTITVDLKRHTTTGVSAADRAATIRALADPATTPGDLSRPGHVLPLRSHPNGVLRRRGHTEAAVDLCRLARLRPAGVLCEITSDDGSMSRGAALDQFAAEHGLLGHHRGRDRGLPRGHRGRRPAGVARPAPNTLRDVHRRRHQRPGGGPEHVALLMGDFASDKESVLVRVHSECLTSEVFGSERCDCRDQLEEGMRQIAARGRGAIVYLRGHEGRGIGLAAKLRAYTLQDGGMDTVDANLAQGLPADGRQRFLAAAQILDELGIDRVLLMTNNPDKRRQLRDYGVQIVAQHPVRTAPHREALSDPSTKRERLRHDLDLAAIAASAASA